MPNTMTKEKQIFYEFIAKCSHNHPTLSESEIIDADYERGDQNYFSHKLYYQIIFSHDFAKAFWGTGTNSAGWSEESNYRELVRVEEWQYHLQQMTLEKDPLKYIERFL